MANAVQIFEYEDNSQFRTIEINGDPWFVLADVCRPLDIVNPSNVAARLDDDEKGGHRMETPGGWQNLRIINESGLYSLILRSGKPDAKRFKKWVTSQVLPTIRRTGAYGTGRTAPAFIRRYSENWDRISAGHFSVISELVVRVWGRLELVGHIMADRAPDGTQLRPDVAVGRRFAEWLRQNHPNECQDFSYYMHKTPEGEFEARQYPIGLLPLFIEYVDTVWIPECAKDYFLTRDAAAVEHLPKLLPSSDRARVGMTRRVTGSATKKRARPGT